MIDLADFLFIAKNRGRLFHHKVTEVGGVEDGKGQADTVHRRLEPPGQVGQRDRAGVNLPDPVIDADIHRLDRILHQAPQAGLLVGEFSLGEVVPYVLKNSPCRVILYQSSYTEPSTPYLTE